MEAIGPVLIVFSIPLIFRWIPPNRFFGLRVPATRGDRSVWYDANALVGRHMVALGLVMVLLEFVLPASSRIVVLRVVGTIGFAIMIVVDWRTANRWRHERATRAPGNLVR